MVRWKRALPLLAAVVMSAPCVFGASVHYKYGKGSEPLFVDEGLVLDACVSLAGLGNYDVTIIVEADGVGSAVCRNQGGNEAPGQNKVPVTSSASTTISADEIKNGNLTACLTTEEPENPGAREAGCPNDNWTADFYDVEFSSVTVTVIQNGQIVLEREHTL